MVLLKIVSNVLRFKPALNLNRVLADLNRGSNSLNSISVLSHLKVVSRITRLKVVDQRFLIQKFLSLKNIKKELDTRLMTELGS